MASASKKVTVHVPEGHVLLMCFYDGTPITLAIDKKKYPAVAKTIKNEAKRFIDDVLQDGYSKEEIADNIQKQLEVLHKKIRSVANFVSNETLEMAWGADWREEKTNWVLHIACLLRLKRIKNDDMNGWALRDHNSWRLCMDGGDVAVVFGMETEKTMKKAKALVKDMSKQKS